MEAENVDKRWCVYIHTSLSGKKYIGITSQPVKDRWGNNGQNYLNKDVNGNYMHPAMAKALTKYKNWDKDWAHEVVCSDLTEEEANLMEIELIALYKTNCCRYNNPTYGYNCTDGGGGTSGVIRSKEFRAHLSEFMSGKPKSKESIEKMRQTKTGKRLTDEEKEIRKAKMSQYPNPFLGKSHTDESKQKMSDAKQGKYLGSNNPKAKLYYCIELNEIFLSARDANEKYSIPKSHICSCCTGQRKYCGKHPITKEPLSWKFVYDEVKDDGLIIQGAISLGYITQEDVDKFNNTKLM